MNAGCLTNLCGYTYAHIQQGRPRLNRNNDPGKCTAVKNSKSIRVTKSQERVDAITVVVGCT